METYLVYIYDKKDGLLAHTVGAESEEEARSIFEGVEEVGHAWTLEDLSSLLCERPDYLVSAKEPKP